LSNQLYQTLEFDRVLDDLARKTHSSLAAERIQSLRPLLSLELVQQSLARISELRTVMDSGESFPLGKFQDIRSYLRSAAVEGSYLEPRAFCYIHEILDLAARIHRFFSKNRLDLPLLQEVSAPLAPNPALSQEISKSIDLKTLEIRDQASPRLATIRREMARARERLRKELEALLDKLARAGILQERLITLRSSRWVLPVKETHRYLVKGVLHDKSASGATVFIEPLETLELNNHIRRLEADERHEIEKVLRALTDLVRKNLPELEQNLEVLVTLDCIHAMAMASKTLNQHEPALNTHGVLKIKKGRHPLLALRQGTLSEVVPLDLEIGERFNTLVITGPNAGGKTVALKTVGLLALMVSCGLHIPADADSQVAIFNRIFAHVGDAQSIEMDLSTFSAHLKGIKAILEEASSGDLVLIDEIGTGTDPQEGAALAMAVLETLTARGVVTVVTTHHGALKAFAHETPGIANGSMAFDSQTLTPTYKFRADLPGSSYALEIAKRMGLPDAVVNRSRSLMGTQANRLEALILKLEHQIEQNERLARDLKIQELVVGDLKKQYEGENARLVREARQLRRKAAEEASALIKQANATVEKAIQTIREKGGTRQAIREARSLIQQEKETLKQELEATSFDEEFQQEDQIVGEVRAGDRVYWRRGALEGTVLSAPDTTGHVLIAGGNLKVRVPKAELAPAKGLEKPSPGPPSQVEVPFPDEVRTEIDIRGMQVDEALEAVDKFVNDALLAGLGEVRVIHGVGTGALRNSVIPFLKQHPLVQATLPGGLHQENMGVTIVEIAGR